VLLQVAATLLDRKNIDEVRHRTTASTRRHAIPDRVPPRHARENLGIAGPVSILTRFNRAVERAKVAGLTRANRGLRARVGCQPGRRISGGIQTVSETPAARRRPRRISSV
jgi:hypothetical protein